MPEPMKCGGWQGSAGGCGAALRAERYGTDPPVDADTLIRCLDCGTPMCRRCAKEHFAQHRRADENKGRRVAFEEVQAILVRPELWEERVRLALSLVTEYLTRPGT
jgi:hypothetical protein